MDGVDDRKTWQEGASDPDYPGDTPFPNASPELPRLPTPDPLVAAMGKMLVAALNREVGLEAAIIDLQRRLSSLSENAPQ